MPLDYDSLDSDETSLFARRAPRLAAWWRSKAKSEQSWTLASLFLLFLLICVTMGTVVNWMHSSDCCHILQNKPFTRTKVKQDKEQVEKIRQLLFGNFDKTLVKQHLANLTRTLHVAGTPENMKTMEYVANVWRSYGLDKVEEEEYEVLLSYPDYERPNMLLTNVNGNWTTVSNGTSTELGPQEAKEQQKDQRAKVWWNAYSADGTAVGTIIYAHECGEEDFKILEKFTNQKPLNFNGSIVICQYGRSWRGSKVYEAEKRNASGVILYLDPKVFGPPPGYPNDFVFPKSIYVPPTGAQRGSLLQTIGDPETPLLPSKPYVFRSMNETELRKKKLIPNIPVMPMGYEDVEKIFGFMKAGGGVQVPPELRGGLNVTYYYNSTTQFRLVVHAKTERRPIKNIIGYIYGDEEPDKLVLLSNHVDAWTFGAQDPNSGTAIHLAVSHAFQKVINETGWRPRRTIVFCAWDAEEPGLIGSNEWVEQNLKILQNRAVALINVDTALQANLTLSVKSVPLLYQLIINTSKMIENPNFDERSQSRLTVYDSWVYYKNPNRALSSSVPHMDAPAGGSDFKPFLQYAGVPALDMRFQGNRSGYALYHTMYEIDWTVENLIDSNFNTSQALGFIWMEVVRSLADSLVIPFSVSDYGVTIVESVQSLIDDMKRIKNITKLVENFDLVSSNLTNAASRFNERTRKMQDAIDICNSGEQVQLGLVVRINDRLMALERAFLTDAGLPNRIADRHVIFASSEEDQYSSALLVGVRDNLRRALNNPNDPKAKKTLNEQISVLQYVIEMATDILRLDGTAYI